MVKNKKDRKKNRNDGKKRKKKYAVTVCPEGNQSIQENERGNTRPQSLENSFLRETT